VLFGAEVQLPALSPTWTKRYLDLNQLGFALDGGSRRLSAIYVLKPNGSNEPAGVVVELHGREAVMALLVNSYPAHSMLDDAIRRHSLQATARLVDRVLTRTIRTDHQRLSPSDLANVIIDDLVKGDRLRSSNNPRAE
jgi:hypothetical protein